MDSCAYTGSGVKPLPERWVVLFTSQREDIGYTDIRGSLLFKEPTQFNLKSKTDACSFWNCAFSILKQIIATVYPFQ